MKVAPVSNVSPVFGKYNKVLKTLSDGTNLSTFYQGNRIVAMHRVGADGFIKGMRIFGDGSVVKYRNLSPKSKYIGLNVTGNIPRAVDKDLLFIKGDIIIDADYVQKHPKFMMTRKGIVRAIKAHLDKLQQGIKTGEVIDLTGKEI